MTYIRPTVNNHVLFSIADIKYFKEKAPNIFLCYYQNVSIVFVFSLKILGPIEITKLQVSLLFVLSNWTRILLFKVILNCRESLENTFSHWIGCEVKYLTRYFQFLLEREC